MTQDRNENTDKKTEAEKNFERFLELIEGYCLHDSGRELMDKANAGFKSGTEQRVTQQLGWHKVAKVVEYLHNQPRIQKSIVPDVNQLVEQPAPKGWVKGLSFFAKKEKASADQSPAMDVNKKTPKATK